MSALFPEPPRPSFAAASAAPTGQQWTIGHGPFEATVVEVGGGLRAFTRHGSPLVAGYGEGRLDLAHHRGRSIHPRLVQAAEHFLRESEQLTGLDDLTLIDYRRPSHDHAEVTFHGPESEGYLVEVMSRELPDPAYLTCRAEDRGRPVAYELVSLSRSVR